MTDRDLLWAEYVSHCHPIRDIDLLSVGYGEIGNRDHGICLRSVRLVGTSKNTPVNDGLAMDADVLWFRRGFVGAGSTFLAS